MSVFTYTAAKDITKEDLLQLFDVHSSHPLFIGARHEVQTCQYCRSYLEHHHTHQMDSSKRLPESLKVEYYVCPICGWWVIEKEHTEHAGAVAYSDHYGAVGRLLELN